MSGEPHEQDLFHLDTIMQAFGIPVWKNLGSQETLPGVGLQLLVEVDGQRYLLRERPEGMLGEDLQHRYAFQRHLYQAGIPVALCQMTPEGEPAVMVGDNAFELLPWISGERFSTTHVRSIQWVEQAGTMLGQLHASSRSYQGAKHSWPSEAHTGSIVQSYLQLALVRAEEHPLEAITVGLSEWARQWEAVLPSAMVAIGSGRDLPEWHIHGDYHALNLRFDTTGVVAVTGLEASRWEKRIFELAYALFYFSALTWWSESTETSPLVMRGFEPERMHKFLRAYGEVCAPVPGEAALLADALMLVSPVASANGPLEMLFYDHDPSELDKVLIDDVMTRLAWASSLPGWLGRMRRALVEMW